jgi:hypothetical protein
MNLAAPVIIEDPMVERLSVQCVDLGIVELPAPLVDNGHTDESRDRRKSLRTALGWANIFSPELLIRVGRASEISPT